MKKRLRITYFFLFILLFAAEICIALFAHDSFIRPHIGDVVVVILICAFLRIIFPDKIRLLPLYATAFAVLIEALQYFDFVKILGLENVPVVSVALGRTFDVLDILCYIAGGFLFFAAEKLSRRKIDEH